MKASLRIGALILCIIALLAAWIWHEASSFLETPASESGQDIQFDVPPGSSPARISRDLYSKGLITDKNKFLWLIRLKGEAGKLQAGRFMLNSGWKPARILDMLVNGSPLLHRITIPEGLSWWQTGKLLADAGFVRFNDFKDIISDPDFLRHYGIPFATAEGFLMPDTYLMKKPDLQSLNLMKAEGKAQSVDEIWKEQAKSVAGRLIDNFWRKTEKLWPAYESASANGRNPSRGIYRPDANELKRLVTLASIVEKETAIDRERARIAGVYVNRLARNMPLQADPTVAYGLGADFAGPLLRSHLADASNPYNTYQKNGLPPGPISSFGLAALKGAINPEKHSYLYFVAITDGGEHKFSQNLEQHNLAVQEYRQQKKKNKAP